MMGHCTIYIEQIYNKSISKLLLSCFHQIPIVNIFPSHGLYLSNMESESQVRAYINKLSLTFCSTRYLAANRPPTNLLFHARDEYTSA